jgi:hypothetical protein
VMLCRRDSLAGGLHSGLEHPNSDDPEAQEDEMTPRHPISQHDQAFPVTRRNVLFIHGCHWRLSS